MESCNTELNKLYKSSLINVYVTKSSNKFLNSNLIINKNIDCKLNITFSGVHMQNVKVHYCAPSSINKLKGLITEEIQNITVP